MLRMDKGKLYLPILIVSYLVIMCILNVISEEPECFQVKPEACRMNLTNGEKCNTVTTDSHTSQIFCCNVTSEKDIYDFLYNQSQNSNSRKY